jgi:SAM-dependent methyltransferase
MTEPSEGVQASVVERFTRIANDPSQEKKFPVGPDSAKRLGYDPAEVDELPAPVTESFSGVGNPFSLGSPQAGDTVLDIGCGAGFDTLLAACRIGPSGKSVGIDMTEAMIDKARKNGSSLGLQNIEFRQGNVERLPVDDGVADLVISNGVFNLCTDKPRVLAEVFRVLLPGGSFQMADILLEPQVAPEEAAEKGTWSD